MNYSQRKHIERLMANAPAPFAGFGLSFAGIKIVESPNRPRYVLPEELLPGVPWPPGYRDEINRWSLEFLGTTNIVPRGSVYMIGNHTAIMRPDDVVRISAL